MRSSRLAGPVLIGMLAVGGCSGTLTAAPSTTPTTTPSRDVQVSATFGTGGGTATTYDPELVPVGARGAVSSSSGDDGTTVTLAVRGLEPDRRYGAHAHTKPCGPTGDAAGPHFQERGRPGAAQRRPGVREPENEIWLDLTTDATGCRARPQHRAGGASRATGAPQSVIVHAMPTAPSPARRAPPGASGLHRRQVLTPWTSAVTAAGDNGPCDRAGRGPRRADGDPRAGAAAAAHRTLRGRDAGRARADGRHHQRRVPPAVS